MQTAQLFPYDKIRDGQSAFLNDVHDAVAKNKCLIAHAPTGLGKTAAALSPALEYALKNDLTVFFLTSRHTQHLIAVETLKQIRKKHGVKFGVVDIVGKKHMCSQEGADALFSSQFYEYCRSMKEQGGCRFYLNLKKEHGLSKDSAEFLEVMKSEPMDAEHLTSTAKKYNICPYEAAILAAQKAQVIIADYNHIFNPQIRENFLKKTAKALDDSIIIVDEGHNLPDRMRDMLTESISSISVERAIKESRKFSETEEQNFLIDFRDEMSRLAAGSQPEKIVRKEEVLSALKGYDFEKVMSQLEVAAEQIRESEKQSFIGSVAGFISAWKEGDDTGYARILCRKYSSRGEIVTLNYECLDPSIGSGRVMHEARSVILMSGTLIPTKMYKDTLGFPEGTIEKEYRSPFPQANRLPIIVPGVTTQFTKRTSEQYELLAAVCVASANEIPGNTAIFFSSYSMMNELYKHIYGKVNKAVFKEEQNLSSEGKKKLLQEFKRAYLQGGLLLAVIGGSFNEGIDLPGEFLNGVIIVGLPLTEPDLHTKKLIEYYDSKYKKGWDYGYVYPAFTKAMQSAGRCIRSGTDRGVMVFVDERYGWSNYYRCFPKELNPKITTHYKDYIKEFFSNTQKRLEL